MDHIFDTIIIGGGPGGYTAALYAARAGLDTLVLEKLSAGGQMALTTQIDNYPGFPEGADGFTLAEQMQQGAERFGARTELAEVLRVDLKANPKVVVTDAGTFLGRTVMIATGANPRPLGVEGEERYLGSGLHYCAACDGMFYKGKTVAVVGGGNTAAADALLLSRVAKKVYIIHRRDALRATKVYHSALENAETVEFCWNSAVTELQGQGHLSGIRLKDLKSGLETQLDVDGIFVSIGRVPATTLFEGQLDLENGYIVADESTRTSVPGVFAVGDVRTKTVRQIVTATADGAVAAHYAEEFLAEG